MSSSDDEEYDIETILKSRKTKRKGVEYLVKWKGVDEDGEPWEPTWESEANIDTSDNQDLLREFREREALAKKPKKVQKLKVKKEEPKKSETQKRPKIAEKVENSEKVEKTKIPENVEKRSRRRQRSPREEEVDSKRPKTEPTKAETKQAEKAQLASENYQRQQEAMKQKRNQIVINPEIVDQRKCIEKGNAAWERSDFQEALRLYRKADRIYSDSHSKSKIIEVEAFIKEQDEIKALKEAEEAEKRRKYESLSPEEKELLNYINTILSQQPKEPLRKNVTSAVKHPTFVFFIRLFLVPLPGGNDAQLHQNLKLNDPTIYNIEMLGRAKFDEVAKMIEVFLKRKTRLISRAVHPDKCQLDGGDEVQKLMNKGRTLLEAYLDELRNNRSKA